MCGLGDGRLSEKGIPPSGLSLHGPLRHLAAVERWWFAVQFAGDDLPMFHFSDDDPDFGFLNGHDDPDQDFDSLDGDVAETFAVWEAECLRSSEIVAREASLDERGVRQGTGEPFSLR